jgi:dCTP deaminase
MILSYVELQSLLGRNVFDAPDSAVQGSSIDVTLGRTLLVENCDPELEAAGELSVVSLKTPSALVFDEVELSEDTPFLLYPGHFALAVTKETFQLPLDISAEFRLRSAAARMGLSHSVAVWAEASWAGALTLEIKNISQYHAIELRAGDRIGAMVFHRHVPVPSARSYKVRGAFNNDAGPTPAKEV